MCFYLKTPYVKYIVGSLTLNCGQYHYDTCLKDAHLNFSRGHITAFLPLGAWGITSILLGGPLKYKNSHTHTHTHTHTHHKNAKHMALSILQKGHIYSTRSETRWQNVTFNFVWKAVCQEVQIFHCCTENSSLHMTWKHGSIDFRVTNKL